MEEKFVTLDKNAPKEEKSVYNTAQEMIGEMKKEMPEEKILEVLKEIEKQLQKPAN